LGRPAGKLGWLVAVWNALERLATTLEGSQAVKASADQLPPPDKAACLQFLFGEVPLLLSQYFAWFYRADQADGALSLTVRRPLRPFRLPF
jgi:hypothetical protein